MAWAARAGILVQQTDKAYLRRSRALDPRRRRPRTATSANARILRPRAHWLEGRIHDGDRTALRASRRSIRAI